MNKEQLRMEFVLNRQTQMGAERAHIYAERVVRGLGRESLRREFRVELVRADKVSLEGHLPRNIDDAFLTLTNGATKLGELTPALKKRAEALLTDGANVELVMSAIHQRLIAAPCVEQGCNRPQLEGPYVHPYDGEADLHVSYSGYCLRHAFLHPLWTPKAPDTLLQHYRRALRGGLSLRDYEKGKKQKLPRAQCRKWAEGILDKYLESIGYSKEGKRL